MEFNTEPPTGTQTGNRVGPMLLVLLSNAPLPCLNVVPPSSVALRRLLRHGAERRQQRARGLAVRHPDPAGTGRPLRVSVCVCQFVAKEKPSSSSEYNCDLQVFPLDRVTLVSSYSRSQGFKDLRSQCFCLCFERLSYFSIIPSTPPFRS